MKHNVKLVDVEKLRSLVVGLAESTVPGRRVENKVVGNQLSIRNVPLGVVERT